MKNIPRKLVTQLGNMLAKGEFDLKLQPIVDVSQSRIDSFEVLVRFREDIIEQFPELSGTEQIVETIEQLNLHTHFDMAVIRKSFQMISEIEENQFGQPLKFSINVCAATLADEYFLGELKNAMRNYSIDSSSIKLEITENTFLSPLASQHVIPNLFKMGIEVMIDDFISGFSNFGAITNPYVTAIKVDRSVIDELSHSDIARRFLRSLLSLTGSLQKKVVVEGIETISQYLFIEALGYPLVQGYFISKPISLEEVPAFFSDFEKRTIPSLFDLKRDITSIFDSELSNL